MISKKAYPTCDFADIAARLHRICLSAVKIEPEAERAYYWSTLALHDQAEEILVVAADDHGCRVWSARSLYERLGAGAVHLHPILTISGLRPECQQRCPQAA